MNDFVYEDLIKRKSDKLRLVFKICSYTSWLIFTIIFNILVLVIFGNYIYLSGMFCFGLWYLVFRLNKNMNTDIELSIVNETVTVTNIIDQKKRIELASFSIREDCEYIGPVTSDDATKKLLECDSIINATSMSPYQDVDTNWICFFVQNSVKYFLVFEFKPSMYKNFRRYNPRNVAPYTFPEDYVEEEF